MKRTQNKSPFIRPLQGSDVDSALTVYSETNTVTVNSLIPGSIYAFQIRARNERGYGPYSNTIYFTTLPLGTQICSYSSAEICVNRKSALKGTQTGGTSEFIYVRHQ